MKNSKNQNLTDTDIRSFNTDFEVRSLEENNETMIRGYALKFNRPSEDLGFIEYLQRDCLNDTDMSDVVALLNHNENYVLARAGHNMTLSVDDTGLMFEFKPTNTSYSRDLVENMKEGLISKCSFAFTIPKGGDTWRKRSDGMYERTVTKIDKLYDVSIVTRPAYSDTEAMLSTRSLNSLENVQSDNSDERERLIIQSEVELL